MPRFLSLHLRCEFSEESWSSEEKELQTGEREKDRGARKELQAV